MSDAVILKAVADILQAIGEDPSRDGLRETPDRILRMYREVFGGYNEDPEAILKKDFSIRAYDDMVVLRDIDFYSTCEHHMLPFFGKAHVAYIPRDRVVGISKLARLVDCFARRLQIQERMTHQIAQAVVKHLNVEGVGVVIEAKHLCMLSRGVKKHNTVMTTSAMYGCFKENPSIKSEFMKLVTDGEKL